MGLDNYEYSDYGSGTSIESCLSWGDGDGGIRPLSDRAYCRRLSSSPPLLRPIKKPTSLMGGLPANSREAVMQEFRMNGSDSPYDPDEKWSRQADKLCGMGRSSAYGRQKSWPEPEATPALRLPHRGPWTSTVKDLPIPQIPVPASKEAHSSPVVPSEMITEEQVRALNSLPNVVLYSLLRELESERDGENRRRRPLTQECRFCKNNGEREAYYRSHSLKDGAGRVCCPVLRAFACQRCGAHGDRAHTLKYCPLTPAAERIKSAAMMRSVRNTSFRRRTTTPSDEFVMFGQTTPSVIQDTYKIYDDNQLDPLWADLARKLSV